MNNSENNTTAFRVKAKQDIKPGCRNSVFFKLLIPAIIFLLSASLPARSQDEANYAVHANIMYHFTKYIDWPDDKKSGNFIIGVIGNELLYDELKKNIADKMVGHQRIVIKIFSASANAFNCQILFLGEEESNNIKKIASKTAGTSTLLVSETEGLAQRGSCINFVIVSDHLKLEINKSNIEKRNLDIASELLQLGKIVK